jgi:hypothetical protein
MPLLFLEDLAEVLVQTEEKRGRGSFVMNLSTTGVRRRV